MVFLMALRVLVLVMDTCILRHLTCFNSFVFGINLEPYHNFIYPPYCIPSYTYACTYTYSNELQDPSTANIIR